MPFIPAVALILVISAAIGFYAQRVKGKTGAYWAFFAACFQAAPVVWLDRTFGAVPADFGFAGIAIGAVLVGFGAWSLPKKAA